MLTDLDLAIDCERTYHNPIPPTWENSDKTIHAYLFPHPNNEYNIAFEGTIDLKEWIADFEAIPVAARGFDHQSLGWVHYAWWREVQEVAGEITEKLLSLQAAGATLYCTGHSKGAANALLYAADAKLAGIKWARVSTFGTPHPGALNGLITSDLGKDYRDMSHPFDPVPDQPFYLPRPRPLTFVVCPPPLYNLPDYGPMISHHIQNYVSALKAINV